MSLLKKIIHPTNMSELDKVWKEQQGLYEAALGAFLVAFNAIEAKAYRIIFNVLALRGLDGFAAATTPTSISKAIEQLKALTKDCPDEVDLDLDGLKELSIFRNTLAHASYMDHLDYDEDGALKVDFQIASHKNRKSEFVQLETLAANTKRVKALNDQMFRVLYELRNKADDARTSDQ